MSPTPEGTTTLLAELARVSPDSARWVELWEEFVERYTPRLLRWLRAQGLQLCDAEDLLQELFRRVCRSVQTFKHSGSGRGWIFTILRHVFRDWCGERRPQLIASGDAAWERLLSPAAEAELERLTAEQLDRERWAEAEERVRGQFGDEIAWRCYELVRKEGRVEEEVAQVLGIKRASVVRNIRRTLERLGTALTDIQRTEREQ